MSAPCDAPVRQLSVLVAIVVFVSADYHLDVQLQLRWGDMDINNHVNNVQFARLFEEARVRSFAQWLPDRPTRLSLLVARQVIEFTAPLMYSPEPIIVRTCLRHVGRSSFTMALRLHDPAGVQCAVAETAMVVIDPATARPTAIPEGMRQILDARLGEPVRFHGDGAGRD